VTFEIKLLKNAVGLVRFELTTSSLSEI